MWDDCVGVRGYSSVEEARAAAVAFLVAKGENYADYADMVRDGEPEVWAVPGGYFRKDSGDVWGDAVYELPNAGADTPKGYCKVLWWEP